ncbi:MAG: 50S ribosomal protein L4 [Bacteroidetes bacterium CG12_big_fil_rev_8_21_14_0_65_60_17]|nr:MAG: 50S ribosomal protein L4 [Bacteroidetes bacterium CG12_big_fil_rev_8_21_14_0_65_60_17]
MKLKIHKQDGSATKKSVDLNEAIFGVEPNDHAIWLDVRRIQANARQGTHKAKERSEVAGSTRKLYRQKGTGNARAGSAKSPLRKSGGIMFGPRPRTYGIKVNRKTQRLARRSALTYKAQGDAVRVVEDFSFESPSSRSLQSMLSAMELADRRVLVLTSDVAPPVVRSGTNLSKVMVRVASELSTLDVVSADVVLFQASALASIEKHLG